jgi:hypothetical protein
MAVKFQQEYARFIVERGVGAHDVVASSPDSYLSYLRSVSTHLSIDIDETTLCSEQDVQRLAAAIEGVRAPRTIANYVSAMRQYVAMIQSMNIPAEPAPCVVEINDLDPTDTQDFADDFDTEDGIVDSESSDEKHYLHSSFREKLLEHLFVAELLKRSWAEHSCDLEIAKPEVDSRGYDLIAEKGGVVRHVQLKSTKRGGNAAHQNIHIALASKPSGCVVWFEFDENTLELGPFRFLGHEPGKKLPPIAHLPIAKHPKANAEGKKTERPQLRRVAKGKFTVIDSFDELYRVLFEQLDF